MTTSTGLLERFEQIPYLDDPYPVYAELREHAPVFRAPGFWYVTRHSLGNEIYRSPKLWASNNVRYATEPDPYIKDPNEGLFSRIYESILMFQDGEAHRRLRRLVNPAFTPRRVETYRDQVRAAVADQLDQATAGGREFDLISDLSLPLPTRVILDAFGFPQSEAYRFRETTELIIPPLKRGTPEEWFAHADEVYSRHSDYVLAMADQRRRRPGDDLISQILAGEPDSDEALTDIELVSLLTFLVTAGFETTAHTFANGVYSLLRNPEQFEMLQGDRSLVASAVEEILRFEPATRNSAGGGRIATEDTVLDDKEIRRGDRVLVCIHGANRDPEVFENPERFDITRSPNRHLSFAAGPHTCLGAALARLEMQVALETLLDRLPDLRLAGEVRWQASFIIRGLERLPVRW